MGSRRHVWWCWAALVAAGCAVNDRGLVRVRHFENATARLVELESFGGHVLLDTPDAGFALGHSRRTYVFAKEGSAGAQVPLADLAADAHGERRLHPVSCPPCPPLGSLGEPVATLTSSEGLLVDVGEVRFGLAVGVRRRAAIVLRSTGSTTVFFSWGSDGEPSAWIGKDPQ